MTVSITKVCVFISFIVALASCSDREPLGYTGPAQVINGDTQHFKIPQYQFLNQDSVAVNNSTYKGKIHVMAFFFTSCPGTCPIITGNLTAVHQKFKDNNKIQLVSISIDPANDTFARLKEYATGFGIDTKQWSFLRNSESYTHDFIQTRLYQSVVKDPNAPGGFDHSSKILLIDEEGCLRKFYEGTDKEEIKTLIADIENLTE